MLCIISLTMRQSLPMSHDFRMCLVEGQWNNYCSQGLLIRIAPYFHPLKEVQSKNREEDSSHEPLYCLLLCSIYNSLFL